MLKVLTSHKGKTHRLSLSAAIHSKTLTWIDVTNPTAEELKQISKLFQISEKDMADALDPEERSRVEENNKYKLIILRTPSKISQEIETTPVGIFIMRNNVLTIHKKTIQSLVEIHNYPEILAHGNQYFITRLIDKMTSTYFKLIQKIDGEIDALEERVFEHGGKKTAMHIFQLKKTLTFFKRSLLSNRETISQVIKMNVLHLDTKERMNFEDIANDINQLIDMTNTHKEILTGALEIHASTISNQLNDAVKKMTVIGSFVLLPTLIASIYGMNFGQPVTGNSMYNMPELSWMYGYPFALGIMLLSCIALYLFFKKKKWL